MEAETRFRAMGSDVHVVVVGGPLVLLETAREILDDLEERWSRFLSTSEVSLVNRFAGQAVRVSKETLALFERAIDGARVTQGRFDPTVLGDVIRAGYARSFELLTEEPVVAESPLSSGFDGIEVDRASSTVKLPVGVGFDPGGVGKGFGADLLVEELMSRGAEGVCANVGGDLRVAGRPPRSGVWSVAVEHPFTSERIALLALRTGAVATSTRVKRGWGPAEDRRHHLIDPATGLPARTGLASATVIAAQGWQAEVLAKAAFVAGLSEGLYVLAASGTDGLLVDDRGSVYPSLGLHRFMEAGGRMEPVAVGETA